MIAIDLLKEYTDFTIFGLLLIISIIAFACFIERLIVFCQIKPEKYHNIYALEIDLNKRLTFIYTTAAIAPFIGLLGTIIGILITFYDIGSSNTAINAQVIMVGLALALKATAAGIFVSLPTMVFYNYLVSKIENKKLIWQMNHT